MMTFKIIHGSSNIFSPHPRGRRLWPVDQRWRRLFMSNCGGWGHYNLFPSSRVGLGHRDLPGPRCLWASVKPGHEALLLRIGGILFSCSSFTPFPPWEVPLLPFELPLPALFL